MPLLSSGGQRPAFSSTQDSCPPTPKQGVTWFKISMLPKLRNAGLDEIETMKDLKDRESKKRKEKIDEMVTHRAPHF